MAVTLANTVAKAKMSLGACSSGTSKCPSVPGCPWIGPSVFRGVDRRAQPTSSAGPAPARMPGSRVPGPGSRRIRSGGPDEDLGLPHPAL